MVSLHLSHQAHEVVVLDSLLLEQLISQLERLSLSSGHEEALDGFFVHMHLPHKLVGTHEHANLLVALTQFQLDSPLHWVARGK